MTALRTSITPETHLEDCGIVATVIENMWTYAHKLEAEGRRKIALTYWAALREYTCGAADALMLCGAYRAQEELCVLRRIIKEHLGVNYDHC